MERRLGRWLLNQRTERRERPLVVHDPDQLSADEYVYIELSTPSATAVRCRALERQENPGLKNIGQKRAKQTFARGA